MVVLSASFTRKLATGKARASNGGERPNSFQRRANKHWFLNPSTGFGGNETTVPCSYCGSALLFEAIEADRIIPGSLGGTYRRENIIPACRQCNARRGDRSVWSYSPNCARRLIRMGRLVSAKAVVAAAA